MLEILETEEDFRACTVVHGNHDGKIWPYEVTERT
jgi:hypothetical protein